MSVALDRITERTRLRARRAVRFMEALWAGDATSADQGLTISPGEVRRRLLHPTELERMRADFHAMDEMAQTLEPAIADADAALAADLEWNRLLTAFDLSALEADLLACALSLDVQPELARVFAYLADDVTAILPSVTLVRHLFDHPTTTRPFDPANLRRWRLAEAEPAPVTALAGWRCTPALAHSLATGLWHDPAMEPGATELMPSGWRARLPHLQPDAMIRAEQRLLNGQVADLSGVRGSGRRTLAAQLASTLGQHMVMIDTPRLLAGATDGVEALTAALRMARFEGALACFTGAGAASSDQWRRVLPVKDLPIIRCYESGETGHGDIAAISLSPLDLGRRIHLWQTLSDDAPPASITTARITAGEIARLARDEDRATSDEPAPELLTRLPTPYDWDDLVLPTETKGALADFAQHVRLRGAVLEGWGFDRLTHLGSGLVALFAGPSGVGKTMAAQVLARELGLELFRIDLAGVVDKYIGETEKRLRAAFAFAERPGVLLMFDEADALFGSRTQAKDSHDRYANLEINYLLQRIETFEGVAVLATNRKSELDVAFRRRLRTMIDFLQPGPAERLALWQLALPAYGPDGTAISEGIDYAQLAQGLNLTGADIKAAALGAAFLAKGEGQIISMGHVLAATQREMAKHGQTMRLSLATEARRA